MSTAEPTAFGASLRRYRVAAHLTQKQLASRADVTLHTIAALEHGARRPPPQATVEQLADALELSDTERADFHAAAQLIGAVAVANAPGAISDVTRRAETPRSQVEWISIQPTPLVDRSQEVETILRMLTIDGVRLLTLVGPSGVGKTRLALTAAADAHLASHFSDGVTLVDLAPIRAPQDVLGTIGRAIGFTEMIPRPLDERLRDFLRERATLLILDNFEQVLPAAAALADLLAVCRSLALLVTSRAPLQVRWEQTLRVAPLPVPDLTMPLPHFAELTTIPSITLFLQRARARRASLALTEKQAPMLAELVAQLDGLPLALELAAARLDVLSLPMLSRRLADRMQLLAVEAPDVPERQQSLEAAVGWSYDLLSELEQRLFRCLGVFVGRVTLDAVAAVDNEIERERPGVVDGDAREGRQAGRTLRRLLSLAEKSLILPARPQEPSALEASSSELEEPEDELEPMFGMLETVREYASEQLAARGELAMARRAHAYFFLALAEQAASQLNGHDQRNWYLRLDREHDNLRAALRWLLDQDDPAEQEAALRLAGALGDFWWRRGYHAEGRRWLEAALTRAPQDADPAVRIHALLALGGILTIQGEVTQAQAMLGEGLALAERWKDQDGVAVALTSLGLRAIYAGEVAEGTRLLQDALRRWESLDDPWAQGLTRSYLGLAAVAMGDVPAIVSHYTAALQWFDTTGDAQLAGIVHCYLGGTAWERGDVHSAVTHVQAGLRTSVALEDRLLLSIVTQTAVAFVKVDSAPDAQARLLGAADALVQATGATMLWDRSPEFQNMLRLREQLARGEGEGAGAYREGRALSFAEVATSILRLLEEATKPLPRPERPQPTRQTAENAGEPAAQHATENPLTAREIEVLRLVAQGLSSKLIARQLSIAPGTVNYHLATAFNKLGVDTRAQAVAVATQRGLL
jgi:predicted ATPase/DNA-binding CsgD family transcriptional regulator/transcriptional regulator with XRE-family HTH domain